jgi:hypothetical protein
MADVLKIRGALQKKDSTTGRLIGGLSARALGPCRRFRLNDTTARSAVAPQSGVDDSRCATHASIHRDGFRWTISGASPAFHAGVPLFNLGVAVVHAENGVRTNDKAHAAPHAFFLIKL